MASAAPRPYAPSELHELETVERREVATQVWLLLRRDRAKGLLVPAALNQRAAPVRVRLRWEKTENLEAPPGHEPARDPVVVVVRTDEEAVLPCLAVVAEPFSYAYEAAVAGVRAERADEVLERWRREAEEARAAYEALNVRWTPPINAAALAALLRREGRSFVDPAFPPLDASLGRRHAGSAGWRRLPDVLPRGFRVVGGGTGVRQGSLGDCWLLCGLRAIAARSREWLADPARGPFPRGAEPCAEGVYQVRLHLGGVPRLVTVDDWVPCTAHGVPAFCRSADGQAWVPLLEKAFAKVSGSYRRLRTGFSNEAMQDLTGSPGENLTLNSRRVAAMVRSGELLRSMARWHAAGYPMCACSRDDRAVAGVGLVPRHFYALLEVVVAVVAAAAETAKGKEGDGLDEEDSQGGALRMWNPWGTTKWSGRLADARARAAAGLADAPPERGQFWVTFAEFARHFKNLSVCHFRPGGWCVRSAAGVFRPVRSVSNAAGGGACYKYVSRVFELDLAEDAVDAVLTVHQRDRRAAGAPPYAAVGLCVASADGRRPVRDSGPRYHRQASVRVGRLPAGRYLVVPYALGRRGAEKGEGEEEEDVDEEEEGGEGGGGKDKSPGDCEFNVTLHCDAPEAGVSALRPREDENPLVLVEHVLARSCVAFGQAKRIGDGLVLYDWCGAKHFSLAVELRGGPPGLAADVTVRLDRADNVLCREGLESAALLAPGVSLLVNMGVVVEEQHRWSYSYTWEFEFHGPPSP